MSAVLEPLHAASADREARLRPVWDRAELAASALILLLMSGALLAPLFSPDQNPDSVPWLRTIWLPVDAAILILVAARPLEATKVALGAALALAPVAWAFASRSWSIDAEVTTRRAFALLCTVLFGLRLAAAYDWKKLIELFAGVFLVLAVGAWISAIAVPAFGRQDLVHPGAWTGLWYEKNQLGWIMTYGCLACLCAALLAPERRKLWSAGVGLCVVAVAMSRSTTSALGVAIVLGGVAGLALVRRGGARALVAVWGVIALGGGLAALLALAPDVAFHLIGKAPTLTGRTDIWTAVLRQAAGRPLTGYGFGAFWLDQWGPAWFVRHEVNWMVPHAHNGWLEMLLELGGVGVALVAVQFLVSAAAAVARVRGGPEVYWALPLMALVVLFSVSESTLMQYNGIAWALYIATAAKLFEWRGLAPGRAPGPPVQLFPPE